MKNKRYLGTAFIIVILILCALSLITMASISFPRSQEIYGKSYQYLMRHVIWMVVGGIFFGAAALSNYESYRKGMRINYLYVVGAFALLMVLIVGETKNGARRWFSWKFITIQPSEFVKIILIIALSSVVYHLKTKGKIKRFPWSSASFIMFLTGVYAVLIVLERAFSNTVQIVVLGLTYLLISGTKFSIISFYSGLIGIAGWFGITKFSYRASRLAAFASNEVADQTKNSLIAIGSGGFNGRFYGNGLQKYGFLPEVHTDYIFSGYAEENGFLGVLFLLLLYMVLLLIIAITIIKIRDLYAKYILIGIFIMFATQIIGNVAVVSNLLPSTGIPLPLMSYGGSGMIVTLGTLGIVYNIIRKLYEQEMGDSLDENEYDYVV